MRTHLWKSITWRIQAWHALALALAITGMMVAFQKYERAYRTRVLDDQLVQLVRPILPVIDPVHELRQRAGIGRRQRPSVSRDQRQNSQIMVDSWISESYWAVAWDRHGNRVHERGATPPPDLSFRTGAIARESFTQDGFRRLRARGPAASTIDLGVPLEGFERGLRDHAWKLAGFGSALFGIGFLIGWLIVRWGLRPVREIGKSASEIAHGDLSRRIDVTHAANELRDLAVVLNDAFSRLEKNIEQRERFTADASHELRTPLAVVLGQIQQLLGKQDRASEDREGLANAERAARRMKKLVDKLMVLARLDSGGDARREPLDLAEIGREVTSEMRGLLARRDASIALDLRPAAVSGDRDALVRVLTNLIGNALHHNPIGVSIGVKTGTDGQGAFVTVEDNGKGIEAEHRERLFERFYRADASRTTRSGDGNSGLGLAICDVIVRQHGGSIGVASELGKGSSFTVRIPSQAVTR